jgi:hypothetical protein
MTRTTTPRKPYTGAAAKKKKKHVDPQWFARSKMNENLHKLRTVTPQACDKIRVSEFPVFQKV